MNNKRMLGAVLVVLLVVLGCRGGASAQGRRVSPHETTMATVDGSAMFIEYGRPSMRGRTIFGSLVRYDDSLVSGRRRGDDVVDQPPAQDGGAGRSAPASTRSG